MKVSKAVPLFELESYKFGKKEPKPDKDSSEPERIARIEESFKIRGLRRSVEVVLLVHRHSHPHILLLLQGTSESPIFRLPGGRLRVGEAEVEGVRRKLTTKLGKPGSDASQWHVHELLATWWRPHFDSALYPYLPAHVTQPKECIKVFLVLLGESHVLAVPKNSALVAVPFFDVYDNVARYGPIISNIPMLASRFCFSFL